MAQPVVYTLGRLIVDLYGEERGVALTEVSTFRKYVGGSAANTAVGLARLGVRTGLISRVGADPFGAYLVDALAAEGVDVSMVGRDPVLPTGLAFAALRPPADSEVLFYGTPNANQGVRVADLDPGALAGAAYLIVGGTALAASPTREAALVAMQVHRAAGGTTCLDVDWRPIYWSDRETADLYYRMALGMSDIVLANQDELRLIGGGSDDPDEVAERLAALGPTRLVAKQGGRGAVYRGPEGRFQVAAAPVPVMNTLGAGDGFAAGWVAAWIDGAPVPEALRFAAAAAALVVSRHSCSEAMPTRAEVADLLSRPWGDPARDERKEGAQ